MAVPWNGVKVFAATRPFEREALESTFREWRERNPHLKLDDIVIRQSSDDRFHCLSVTVFYLEG